MAEKRKSERTMRIGIDPATVDQQAAATSRPPARGEMHAWRTQHQKRDTPFYKLLESVYDAVLKAGQPAVVGWPWTSMLSLIANRKPLSAPSAARLRGASNWRIHACGECPAPVGRPKGVLELSEVYCTILEIHSCIQDGLAKGVPEVSPCRRAPARLRFSDFQITGLA